MPIAATVDTLMRKRLGVEEVDFGDFIFDSADELFERENEDKKDCDFCFAPESPLSECEEVRDECFFDRLVLSVIFFFI